MPVKAKRSDAGLKSRAGDDTEQRLREVNRAKQRRCRARKKAAQQATEAAVDDVRAQLAACKDRIPQLLKQIADSHRRIHEAAEALAAAVAASPALTDDARHAPPAVRTPRSVSSDDAGHGPAAPAATSTSDPIAGGADCVASCERDVERGVALRWPTRPPGAPFSEGRPSGAPCVLFAGEDGGARPPRRVAVVSRSRIGCTGVRMEKRVEAFRAATARHLRCGERDVLWLIESDRFPDATRDQGVRTLYDTPECAARVAIIFLASFLEMALIDKTAARMEAALRLPEAAEPASPPASPPDARRFVYAGPRQQACFVGAPTRRNGAAVAPDWRLQRSECPSPPPNASPEAEAAADDDRLRTDVDNIAEAMHKVFLTDATLNSAPPSDEQSRFRTVADVRAVAKHVFASVVRARLQHLHPADVIKVASRFRALYGIRNAAALAPGGAPLTAGSAHACVLDSVHAVLQDACAYVRAHPVVPELPRGRRALMEGLDALYAQAGDCQLEFLLVHYLISLDRPAACMRIDHGFKSFDRRARSFEQVQAAEVACYERLQLSQPQKAALAALQREYRAQIAALDGEKHAALEHLGRLPSAADMAAPSAFGLFELDAFVPLAQALDAWVQLSDAVATGEAGGGAPPLDGDAARRRGSDAPGMGEAGEAAALLASARPLVPRVGWAQRLLGASGEATAAAAAAVVALRATLRQRVRLRLWCNSMLRDTLSWKQHLVLWGGMSLVMDRQRLCDLAAAELRCDRVFGRLALCGADDAL